MKIKLEPRHWTFIGLFLTVAFTMLLQIKPEIPLSNDTNRFYNYIETLPAGSILMISFDHEASSIPEIKPIALAVLRHAFSKGHKLIGVALFAEGTAIGYRLMQDVANEYDKSYGEDYVYLGFRPQFIAAILSMGESIQETYPGDYQGNDYDQIKLLEKITNYDDLAGVISISDGSLTTHWIEYGHSRFDIKVLTGTTAAMVTTYDPYLASGQLEAMFAGLRGAAEYENLIGREGGGLRGMTAQAAAHVYIILLIAVGNVIYFRTRKKGDA